MSRHRQEQFVASLEYMRGSSEPSDTDGSASCAPASVAPNVMEDVDEEDEEAAVELDATEEPSAGEEPSGKEASTEVWEGNRCSCMQDGKSISTWIYELYATFACASTLGSIGRRTYAVEVDV
jgi:hypothetical protein